MSVALQNIKSEPGRQYVALVNEIMAKNPKLTRRKAWLKAGETAEGKALLAKMHQPLTVVAR